MLVPGFVAGEYQALSPILDNEDTINLVIERLTPQAAAGKAAKAFFLRPGVREWADVATAGSTRAAFEEAGRAFRVIGDTFYELDSAGTETVRGTVAVDGNPATISSNGDGGSQLFITSGDKGYIFDLDTNSFTEEVSSGCTMGGYLDTFFVYLDAATSTLYKSEQYDGTTWDPLDQTQRGLAGDPWRALCVSKSQRVIILAGKWTTDIYYNAGDNPFPFRPRPDALLPHGIAAPFSIKDIGSATLWIAQHQHGRGYVVSLSGATVEPISNPALDKTLEGYGDLIEKFEADAFTLSGHTYYFATIDAATHVYDLSCGEWTKWLTWNSEERHYVGWRPMHHVFAFGKHLMGDRLGGTIWEISQSFYSDVDDKPIRWLRRCPLPWANNKRVFVSRVELLHEPGVGTGDEGQGDDPVVMMKLSYNSGKTWSAERARRLGKQGEYDTAAVWDRCGSGDKPVIEFTGTDPAPVRIIGLEVDMQPGLTGRRAA